MLSESLGHVLKNIEPMSNREIFLSAFGMPNQLPLRTSGKLGRFGMPEFAL